MLLIYKSTDQSVLVAHLWERRSRLQSWLSHGNPYIPPGRGTHGVRVVTLIAVSMRFHDCYLFIPTCGTCFGIHFGVGFPLLSFCLVASACHFVSSSKHIYITHVSYRTPAWQSPIQRLVSIYFVYSEFKFNYMQYMII